jgi:hypothetical protein
MLDRLERLKDLYYLGDVTRTQYLFRNQELEQELAALDPPEIVDVARQPRCS